MEFGVNGLKVGLRIITVLVIEHSSTATCTLSSLSRSEIECYIVSSERYGKILPYYSLLMRSSCRRQISAPPQHIVAAKDNESVFCFPFFLFSFCLVLALRNHLFSENYEA